LWQQVRLAHLNDRQHVITDHQGNCTITAMLRLLQFIRQNKKGYMGM
jgi:hypothetical protein